LVFRGYEIRRAVNFQVAIEVNGSHFGAIDRDNLARLADIGHLRDAPYDARMGDDRRYARELVRAVADCAPSAVVARDDGVMPRYAQF
jgi:hypothetical protein